MVQATPSADVIVIGAGVIGLSTALELLREGLRVTVLAREPVGKGSASWAGGGILSPLESSGVDDATLPILRDSLHRYAQWCDELLETSGIDPEYWICGMRVLEPADAAAWRAFGQRSGMVVVPPPLVADRLLVPNTVAHLPDVAQVRSPRLLRALAAAVRAGGGNLMEHAEVVNLLGDARVVGVQTARHALNASTVVVAGGAWSQSIFAGAQVTPTRGEMLLLRGRPGELDGVVLSGGRYLIPRRDGVIVVGSTLERVGYQDTPSAAGSRSILESVRRIAPQLAKREILAHWSGLRPEPAGARPQIGWAPHRRGLFVNTGHFRLGITLAPGSARAAARQILSGSGA